MIICPVILVFQSRLSISSSNPIIDMITAHIPIIMKSWSALPRNKVVVKKAIEVAIPPNGDMFLLLNLFSLLVFFFLNCFVKCKKVLFSKADSAIANSAAMVTESCNSVNLIYPILCIFFQSEKL